MKIRSQFLIISGLLFLMIVIVVAFEISFQFASREDQKKSDYTVSCLSDVFEINLLVHEILLYSDIQRPYDQLEKKIDVLSAKMKFFKSRNEVFSLGQSLAVESTLKSMKNLLGYLKSAPGLEIQGRVTTGQVEVRERMGAQLLQRSQTLYGAFLLLREEVGARAERDDILRSFIEMVVLAFLFLLGIVHILLFGQRVTSELGVLEAGALEISRGNRDFMFPGRKFHPQDEFDTVRNAFNTMLASLRSALHETKAQNKELETLLYVVSHDLSEPLRSVEFFSQAVKDRHSEKLDAEAQDYLSRSAQGARRMKTLLNEILKLSRVRSISRPVKSISGASVVKSALSRYEHLIQEKKAKVYAGADFPDLLADEFWVTEAVVNLISNALKYTSEGQVPDIEIEPYRIRQGDPSGELGFVVCDRGPGVPDDLKEKIFILFQRGVGREIEGSGAGLAIVKSVAERYGGRAWVEDREGGGSCFYITFKSFAADSPFKDGNM